MTFLKSLRIDDAGLCEKCGRFCFGRCLPLKDMPDFQRELRNRFPGINLQAIQDRHYTPELAERAKILDWQRASNYFIPQIHPVACRCAICAT